MSPALRNLAFRKRLLLFLSLFALIPAFAVTVGWGVVVGKTLPLLSENTAWERVASSGTRVFDSLRSARLTGGQREALRGLEQELEQSLTQANRFRFLADRAVPVAIVGAVLALALLAVVVSRVAGHLSRQLSRPLNELVGWTELIAHDQPLPEERPVRGAPEFNVLRQRMRRMAAELSEGRERAVESERLRAFRESARRFAHELKNPLTPIQFAVARLEREAPPSLGDAIEVLRTETRRLDQMSRAFSQFGRLPEGPVSDVDIAELVRYTTRATVPPEVAVEIAVPEDLPMVQGHHDALQRALSNVLLNAVDAVAAANGEARIRVEAHRARLGEMDAVGVSVRDTGHGIPAERIENIWEPYVTSKPGGTGLGLAIARQAILAHHGRVSAESIPGQGTEIRFVLPVRPGAASAVSPSGEV
ncbi:MAG TPA: ATP-binding protein [Gemmatimonadaceae bacterium]|nr:ATP-binding protein [Gemmatimonadaceae bacterium]